MTIKPPDDALPLTALVPELPLEPITLLYQHAGLCLALVERAGAHLLSPGWDVPGVYVLVDPLQPDGSWGCYVGKAPQGLRTRLQHHLRGKDHWHRALLVARDTTHGFNSAQVGWLEGRIYDLLNAAELTRLHNSNRPSDETLPAYERTGLEACVVPITRALRLLGFNTASSDDSTPAMARRNNRFYGITVAELIAAGSVPAGSQLVSTNGSWPGTAVVEADGSVTTGNVKYATPSAAASAIKGGAANGWDFWALQTGTGLVPLSVVRAQYLDKHQAAKASQGTPQ